MTDNGRWIEPGVHRCGWADEPRLTAEIPELCPRFADSVARQTGRPRASALYCVQGVSKSSAARRYYTCNQCLRYRWLQLRGAQWLYFFGLLWTVLRKLQHTRDRKCTRTWCPHAFAKTAYSKPFTVGHSLWLSTAVCIRVFRIFVISFAFSDDVRDLGFSLYSITRCSMLRTTRRVPSGRLSCVGQSVLRSVIRCKRDGRIEI